MNRVITLFALLTVSALTVACGSQDTGGTNNADARVVVPDADVGGGALPTWILEDVQPQSPRVGQTYGLDTFTNKSVVVVLLEGF